MSDDSVSISGCNLSVGLNVDCAYFDNYAVDVDVVSFLSFQPA